MEDFYDIEIEDGEIRIGVAFIHENGDIRGSIMVDVVSLMRKLADRTDNRIDDHLVDLIENAIRKDDG